MPSQGKKTKPKKKSNIDQQLRNMSDKTGIPVTKLKDQLLSYALDQVNRSSHVSVNLENGSIIIGSPIIVATPSDGAVAPEDHPSFGVSRGGEDPDAYIEIDMSGLDGRE